MRPSKVDVAGVGNSAPVPVDIYISPFQLSLEIQVVSGTIDATVEYTFDDVFDGDVTLNWTAHADLANEVAKAHGTILNPVRAVRLVNAGTGTARLIIIQAGRR